MANPVKNPAHSEVALKRVMPRKTYDFRMRGGLRSRLRTQDRVVEIGLTIWRVLYRATGGTFRLTVVTEASSQQTANIAWNASAATVQAAIVALSNVGPADVRVQGGPGTAADRSPFYVTFEGALEGQDVQVTLQSSLTGVVTPPIATQMQTGKGEFADQQTLTDDRRALWRSQDQFRSRRWNKVRAAAARALGVGKETPRQKFDPRLVRPTPGQRES